MYRTYYKMNWRDIRSKHQMFPSFALLSGIVLFSSAVAAVTHEVTVGDGLKFDPSYIVKPQTSLYIEC
jgi:hypothetical protein